LLAFIIGIQELFLFMQVRIAVSRRNKNFKHCTTNLRHSRAWWWNL